MLKSILKGLAACTLLTGLLSASAPAAHAYNWSSTDQYGTWNNSGYWVQNDIWGASPGNQTIYANSYSNWWVVCKYSGSGIKSYPATGINIGKSVNSLGTLKSSFNGSSPGGSSYDAAYDIWLNGNSYEVMVWNQWSGTKPIAGSYDSNGNAVPTQTNVNVGGSTYNVYRRGSVTSFLRTSQTSSGSVDLKAILQWVNGKGWFNNPTVSNVQYGWEIISTGGTSRQFTLNSYSVSK